MRHGCTVAVAAVFITGWGFISTADAACNPRNPTACTSEAQPAAAAPQPKAKAPLQLKRFIKLGPARRSGAHTAHRNRHRHRTAHKARHHKEAARPIQQAQAKPEAPAPVETSAPVTPKAVPTVSVPAPALALAPATGDRTVGFAAPTEPWSGESAFAATEEVKTLPSGVTIAPWDQVNAIDLAADAKAAAAAAKKSDLTTVSLVTPANASTPSAEPTGSSSKSDTSWMSWLYEKLFDGALAAVLAVRSIFV